MKPLMPLLSLWLVPFLLHADPASRVRVVLLDQEHPVEVHVSNAGMTTLEFPDPIESYAGAYTTIDPVKDPKDFVISKGEEWFNVQALNNPLHPGRETNLNVVLYGKVYVVVLKPSALNDYAVLFRRDPPLPAAPPDAAPKVATEDRVEGGLTKLVSFDLLAAQEPGAYVGMDVAEFRDGKNSTETDKIRVTVTRALRDSFLDTVFLAVELQNKTDALFRFDPQAVKVRVGDAAIYPATRVRGDGTLPPKGTSTLYVALAGQPGGVDVHNRFTPIVEELK